MDKALDPFYTFRFRVDFTDSRLSMAPIDGDFPLASGAFSECSGLEATMEPKAIKSGGHNYGDHQRVGPVTFATVILKRGITYSQDLWKWFEMITLREQSTYRLTATITLRDIEGNDVMAVQLKNVLPTKFKAADFNAKATEVGIEELHLAHEGLSLKSLKSAPASG